MHAHRWILRSTALALLAAASAQAQDHVTQFTAADGTSVVLHSGPPAEDRYGPAPAFDQLDANHDGYVSRTEADSYPPLLNDFDFAGHHANRISKAQYDHWVQTQLR